MKSDNSPYFLVQSVDRAFQIFKLFIQERKPLGITEVAQALKLHKSVVHRLLATMQSHQLLEQVTETGKYKVGPMAFELGSVYMNNSLMAEGRRVLPQLAEETGGLAHMGILQQGSVLYLINQEPMKSMRMNAPVGVRKPLSTTALGKALLAWKEEDEVKRLLQEQDIAVSTPHLIPTIEASLEELRKVRETGYAVDNEEMAVGFRCIAAPVRDQTGEVIAAISMGGRIALTENLEKIADLVVNCANLVSERLGYVTKEMF
ncbi:IclR family transcriptional regulator [Paenibacillus eucommiae]|uniref:DNA-binding IclR family transcriptional regulator n=1 Tax=Paenibacillus eucommiae TaxID=1355755 RepID=A0ABS4IY01_9BACL|nr:IclR family transcriptional regulator [Paenibacillus eucommiae]MBP1992466.1 DNA-binding IclR family transcriptional regulator [Paenibacillus eucommiae]